MTQMTRKRETGEGGDCREPEIWKANEGSLTFEDPVYENKRPSLMITKEETGEPRENSVMELNKFDDFDQTSPRGILEIPNTESMDSANCSSIGSSSSNESVSPEGLSLDCYSLQWKTMISRLQLKKKSLRWNSAFLPSMTSSETSKKSFRRILSSEDPKVDIRESVPLVRRKPSWRSFDYQELAAATDNFSPEKLIGKGGHAEVYRGCLQDGEVVAVKRLTRKKTEEERIGDFLSELGIIAHVDHSNAVHLLGFGVEGGLHLVLQFARQGSLASILHGSRECLQWGIRFRIALGIAEGLLYLHQGCHRRIIHRDIKASNILLTHDYQPQISDFGLAMWLPDKWTHRVVYPIEGTIGYLAPEYFMHGVVNEKTDVFAFGVLLLELITGRPAVDSCRQSLVIWAKPLLETSNMKELADPSLGDVYEPSEMSRVISAASACICYASTLRPHMNQIVQLLRDDQNASGETIVKERMAIIGKPPFFNACDSEDYISSSYDNDLDRHKQLALEQ